MFRLSLSEREDLQRLIRQREKVLKSAAKQRSSELIADFENQMSQKYSFDQDEVWEAAAKAVEKAQRVVAARCVELGIPKQFAPSLHLQWCKRGYDNAVKKQRDELRNVAKTQIEAIDKKAITEIEMQCLNAQEQIAVAGLTSEAARAFIDRLPRIEKLMAPLSFDEIAGESKPPLAEQLVSSNAMRQRRYREHHRNELTALRNATVTHEKSNGAA